MGLIRIFTKRRGQPPDLDEPVVLSEQRDGITVQAAAAAVSKELLAVFHFALVWGECSSLALLPSLKTRMLNRRHS